MKAKLFLTALTAVEVGRWKDHMDTITIIQIAQGLSNVFSVIVIALGYYALVRVTRKSV
jgi:ABC-type proline/glycine betaine transport system permease subunit